MHEKLSFISKYENSAKSQFAGHTDENKFKPVIKKIEKQCSATCL